MLYERGTNGDGPSPRQSRWKWEEGCQTMEQSSDFETSQSSNRLIHHSAAGFTSLLVTGAGRNRASATRPYFAWLGERFSISRHALNFTRPDN